MSGTFEIEMSVPQTEHKFINGLIARVTVETQNSQTVTLVPPAALTEADGDKGYVYVVQPSDTTARKVPVTIAYISNTEVAVLEPLNRIGKVITSGAAYLEDGTKVNVTR
jgi:multidrug efflux pump subunit AcrA (membrane-fusion protein)